MTLLNSSAYFFFSAIFLITYVIGDMLYQQWSSDFVDLPRLKFHVYGVVGIWLALGWWAESKAGEQAFLAAEECLVEMTERVDGLEERIEVWLLRGGE